MPINSSGQGYSENTPSKQENFRYFIDIHLGICKGIFDKARDQFWLSHKYHYIDLNAGRGITEEYVYGSPVIFLKEAMKRQVTSRCYFVDVNASVIDELKKNISEFPCQAEYFPYTNHIALENISETLKQHYGKRKKKLYGLLYSDENGIVPFDELAQVFSQDQWKTIDILVYFSGTTIKRCLKAFGSDSSYNYRRLTEYIGKLPKTHWQIRQPAEADKHQWSFLFGTNWDVKGKMGYPPITQANFYDIKSSKGERILEYLAHTNKEIQQKSQPLITGFDELMGND